jgi:Asp-tRNA(Asn)/Glu-tRNA(Gln) amidotransferase A subunit family amidase
MNPAGNRRRSVPIGVSAYSEIRERVLNAEVSVSALTRNALEAEKERRRLNAFITMCPDRAERKAAEVDERVRGGKAGRLAVMVMAV